MLKLDQGLWVATVQSCYNMALQASTNVLKAEPRIFRPNSRCRQGQTACNSFHALEMKNGVLQIWNT